jgi:branched-chain amino acid transport system permease protein
MERSTAPPVGLTDPAEYRDRALDWYEFYDRERRHEIRAILREQPEIIEEHRANPVGYREFHSPPLQRVLNYLRAQPVLGKYYIYSSDPWEEYRIAVIVGRGAAPEILPEPVFATEEEAMHGVFMKRVEALMSSDD